MKNKSGGQRDVRGRIQELREDVRHAAYGGYETELYSFTRSLAPWNISYPIRHAWLHVYEKVEVRNAIKI